MTGRARAVVVKPFAPIGRAAAWVRSDYPLDGPCGHIALVALCCRQNRKAAPHR